MKIESLGETFDLETGFARKSLHEFIDEVYRIFISQEFGTNIEELNNPEYLSTSVDSDYDYESAEDLKAMQKDREKLHELVSNKDIEGLLNFKNYYIDLEFHKAEIKSLFNNYDLVTEVEELIKEKYAVIYLEENIQLTVSQSGGSNSFYIADNGERVIKISDHNTNLQKAMYKNTDYIDIRNYKSKEELFNDIEESINNYLYEEHDLDIEDYR